MTDLRPFIAGLPKAELHVHHVGSASPRIVAELAANHPDSKVPTDPEALADYFTFTDFAHFIEVYLSVVDLIRTPEDVRLLTFEVARDMARQNIRYAELTITPFSSTRRGIDEKAFMAAIEDARTAAERELGVVLRWCFDIPGEAGLEAAAETARLAVDLRPEGLVSFGLGGPEIGVPRPQFKPYFDRAIAAGLRSVPHAGETTGPQTVWDALNDLRAERIGHGTSSVQDPKLLAHLAEHRIPLEVCPTSNLATRAVTDLEQHPGQGDGRRRRPRHGQQRRPADVRHRPQQRVRGHRPTAGPGRTRCRRSRQERGAGVVPRPGRQGPDRLRDRHVHRRVALPLTCAR
ncbi:UNVERIFIED_CONTAM: aminodeoxyfutalosine deaminase [Streptomyces graminofaciens]